MSLFSTKEGLALQSQSPRRTTCDYYLCHGHKKSTSNPQNQQCLPSSIRRDAIQEPLTQNGVNMAGVFLPNLNGMCMEV